MKDKLTPDNLNLHKEKIFRLLGRIKTNDPKEFWNKLKLKHKGLPFNFKKNELYNYFKKLSGDHNENSIEMEPEAKDVSEIEFECDVDNQEISDILNRVTTVDEVKKVILKLKNGKAGGLDKIIP